MTRQRFHEIVAETRAAILAADPSNRALHDKIQFAAFKCVPRISRATPFKGKNKNQRRRLQNAFAHIGTDKAASARNAAWFRAMTHSWL